LAFDPLQPGVQRPGRSRSGHRDETLRRQIAGRQDAAVMTPVPESVAPVRHDRPARGALAGRAARPTQRGLRSHARALLLTAATRPSVSRRTRRGAPALALAALAAALLALTRAAPAGAQPYVDGISDQNVPYWNGDVWGGGPPAGPFAQFVATSLVGGVPAPLRYARYVVAYDVTCDEQGPAFATFERWLVDVEALGLEPVVAFWYGDFDGNRCPLEPQIPSTVAQYNGAVAAFLARFPRVRTIEPWNEPNNGRGPDVTPETAASFWLAIARGDCATRACDTVIAGDFNDAAPDLAGYERRYVAALVASGAADVATDWGIHPYAAVNRESPATLLEFESGLPDRAGDRVWYTEVGAYYCTPGINAQTGYGDAVLQDLQEQRARYLVGTLMQPRFDPAHVFYYEFMYKNDLPGPCATDDSALYGPPGPGGPPGYAARAAAATILPYAASPVALPGLSPRASMFDGAVYWRPLPGG
jgi:hypothetical protein